jgi:thioredoxin 1
MFSSDDEEIKVIKQRKMAELQKALISKTAMSSIREPITLTDSNFKNELSKYPILFIDFWAPWCGPCKMIAPIIEQLALEYTGKVVFGKVNIDENRMITQSFGIQSIPTMMIFKNGKAVDIIVGAIPKTQIETRLYNQGISLNK